jgi:hypothetical protein
MPPQKDTGKSLFLKFEDLKPYETVLLTVDNKAPMTDKNSSAMKTFNIQKVVCKNDFCCNFTLEVVMKFIEKSKWKPATIINGDEMYHFRY